MAISQSAKTKSERIETGNEYNACAGCGGDPHVSPLQRRQFSSEAPSTDSPYMAPDSSSFEEFTDCSPDDCDSSPALNNGKRKCETSSDDPQTEQPQLSPAPQALPSSSADVQLAEQLDTITLSFTSFLSPSTWLGPFTSYPRFHTLQLSMLPIHTIYASTFRFTGYFIRYALLFNLGQVYPITSANTVVPTGEIPLIAPQAIANQIPYIERVPQEAAGLPQVTRTAIFCTSPWLSQQPNVPIYAVSTAANQLQDTMPQRHAAINYYHVPLSSIFGNPVTPSAALSPAVVPTYRLNQQHEQQYIVPATRLASAYTAGHGYVFQQRRHQAVHNNTNNQAMAPIHLPAGMAEIPRGTTWQIQQPSSTAGPAIHSGRATTAYGHHSDGNNEGEVKAP
ncbi:predicted protein [Histoplasma capsulatum G186AR]|uniref:Uncharacterized protein n=1 Tax=Ajellomyces capsulatus (strain G186AR / H82 / ATCC MYA-2454 / RMSCC 2432) TaxID=447093 RepID=C0NLA5_AJECG|nr:uncharacterized protein HCBG_03935 [Histoplasma capsulatum G186AR]EEH08646.1 predicted protein [Histoplasma capsulatum G186AR]